MSHFRLCLCVAVVILQGCGQEPSVSLAELAAPQQPESQLAVAGSQAPLVAIALRQPPRLVSIFRPLLGLADDVQFATTVADELDRVSGLYGEVTELALVFDDVTGQPVIQRLEAFVILRPAAGSEAKDLLAWWRPRLALLPTWPGGGGTTCDIVGDAVACGPQGLPVPPEIVQRAGEALSGSLASLQVEVDIPRVVTLAEDLLTVPLLWAALPEDVTAFARVHLELTEDPDRLALALVTNKSGLAQAFAKLFEPVERPITLPREAPVIAYLAVRDLEARLENIQNLYDNKVPLTKRQQITRLLDKSWQNQMLELADGLVGVVLVGELPMTELDLGDPLDMPGLVYFIQVAEQDAMEGRLKHVFNDKYFIMSDGQLASGDKVTRAFWKKGKKGKDSRERLAWFFQESTGTYFFGPSVLLQALQEQLELARQADSLQLLQMGKEEAAVLRIAPGPFVNRLTATSGGGIGAAMALGMVKNALGTIEQSLVVKVRQNDSPEGASVVSLELVGALATVRDAVQKSDSLLQMLPKAK